MPTRNSSSIGASSGAMSLTSAGVTAGTPASPAERRTTSSSSASTRSASTATCCFSSATLVDPAADPRPAGRRCAGRARRPCRRRTARAGRSRRRCGACGDPMSSVALDRGAGAAADGRVGRRLAPCAGALLAGAPGSRGRRRCRWRARRTAAEVGVGHDAHRARVDDEPLELVEVHARARRRARLDDVAVRHDGVDRVVAEPGVPVAHGVDGAGLHVAHRLAALAGERHRRRVRLHDLPQRVLGELLQLAAGPVAVAHLADPVVDVPRRPGRARRASGPRSRGSAAAGW